MKNNKIKVRWLMVLALFAGLVAGGCSEEQKQAPPRPVPQVAVLTILPERILLTTELPARTRAFRTSEIRPQVSGLILNRFFTEGASINAKDRLYQIDPSSFKAALKTANAGLERARASLPSALSREKRYNKLLSAKAVSQQIYDDTVAALKQVEADIHYWQASVETARINLDHALITAPISGRIGRSAVSEGAFVTAYQPVALAVIQQMDPIYVDMMQSTSELLRLKKRLNDGRLKKDMEDKNLARLKLEDGSHYALKGELKFRDVTVDQATGSVVLRAVFPNPDQILLPGMFVRTVINEGINETAVLIPQQAVARDPKGNPVALIVGEDDTVSQRALTLDRAVGNRWLVATGLEKGDRIIVEGLQKVRPGARVKTIPFQKNGEN